MRRAPCWSVSGSGRKSAETVTFELLIAANPYGIRAAEVAGGEVRAFHVENADRPSHIGDICHASCSRPMLALGGAFFDAGFAEPVFMARAGGTQAGQGMTVQVSADATLGKGMRVSRQVCLTGRLLVLDPEREGSALAASIGNDPALEELAARIAARHGGHITLRFAAAKASPNGIEAEAARLAARWEALRQSTPEKPGCLYHAGGLFGRLLRDIAPADVAEIAIDDSACFRRACAFAEAEAPDLRDRLCFDDADLFERHDCAGVLEEACGQVHRLPSGGRLYIEQTRAMVTIDVDTASHARPGRGWVQELAEGIAQAIVRRNLSGIVMIDTPRTGPANARALAKALDAAMCADRVPHRILGATKGGLLEMTRQRIGTSLDGAGLHGTGAPSACAAAFDIAQHARRERRAGAHRLRLRAAPGVASLLRGEAALPALAPWLGIVCEVSADNALAMGEHEVSRV